MKLQSVRKSLSCLAAAIVSVFAVSANGAMLVNETFTYADGGLVGKDPPVGGAWVAHSGAGATPVLVTSGKIAAAQGAGSREDVSVPFEGGFAAGAGTVLYAGFDVSVADPGAAIADVYFAHFLQGVSTFTERLFITAPTSTGYRLALSNGASLGGTSAYTSDLSFGQTYRAVVKYDYTGANGALWINPSSEASPSLVPTDAGFSNAVVAFAFRQAAGNTTQTIDNLYVSTTFDGALTGTEVPEPVSAGLVAVAGLGLMFSRRRSR